MERKSNVKFDRNGNCSSVDSILSLSSMKIIFKKIFFYVLIPRTQRSNSQWRKNPIKFLLVFIKEFLLLLFFFLKYKIHIWRNKGDQSSWTLQLLSPINFIDENIQENFLLRFNTKNPFQDRILNGEKIPPRPFFFFFEIQNSTISNSNDRSSWTRCSVRSKSNCLRRVIRRGGGRNRSTNNRNEIFFANAPSSCDSPRRDGLSRIKKPSHVPVARGITLEFTLEERFVSRWTRRSRTIYRRTGFIGSKFNGYLVPIPIQCAPWSNEGFPLWWWENVLRILSTISNRGKEKSREEKGGSAINRISGCKIDLCAVSCVFIRRVVTRGFLSTFISRYINVSGRNYTPSRAAHSLIHSAIIIALPPRPSIPAFAPSQGKRVLLIS